MADNPKKGLYRKFKVERADGRSAPGQKHERCNYYVLDLDHDIYAAPALEAYATACAEQYPALSADLLALVSILNQHWQGGPFQHAGGTDER